MLRNRTAVWFECKVRYDKTTKYGLKKSVKEQYVVDALTFTEAESSITKELEEYISDMFRVIEEKIAPYEKIVLSDEDNDDKYYKVRVAFLDEDDNGKEKKTFVYYLVQAHDTDTAGKHITEALRNYGDNCAIVGINETRILDVFEHDLNANNAE